MCMYAELLSVGSLTHPHITLTGAIVGITVKVERYQPCGRACCWNGTSGGGGGDQVGCAVVTNDGVRGGGVAFVSAKGMGSSSFVRSCLAATMGVLSLAWTCYGGENFILQKGPVLKSDLRRLNRRVYPHNNATTMGLNQYKKDVPNGNDYNLVGDSVGDLPTIFFRRNHTYLSVPRSSLIANAWNETVLFAGGALQEGLGKVTQTAVVDILNTTTMHWTVGSLSQARQDMDTAKSRGRIVFAGGWYEGDDRELYYSDTIDVFDYTLNAFLPPLQMFDARANTAVCDVENNEIFISGGVSRYLTTQLYYSDTIDVYDPNTHSMKPRLVLPLMRSHHAAACGDGICMFGGGYTRGHFTVNEYPQFLNEVNVLNIQEWRAGKTTSMWSHQQLKVARADLSAVFHEHKICFAGGMSQSGKSGQLDCYFTLEAQWGAWQMSLPRSHPIALALQGVFVFAAGLANGGTIDGGTMWQKEGQAMRAQRMELFNGTVLSSDALALSVEETAGAATGDKFFFGGGINNQRRVTARVEILQLQNTIRVAQPPHYRNEYPQWIPIGELLNESWTIPEDMYRL